jgi:hypothetical protein
MSLDRERLEKGADRRHHHTGAWWQRLECHSAGGSHGAAGVAGALLLIICQCIYFRFDLSWQRLECHSAGVVYRLYLRTCAFQHRYIPYSAGSSHAAAGSVGALLLMSNQYMVICHIVFCVQAGSFVAAVTNAQGYGRWMGRRMIVDCDRLSGKRLQTFLLLPLSHYAVHG